MRRTIAKSAKLFFFLPAMQHVSLSRCAGGIICYQERMKGGGDDPECWKAVQLLVALNVCTCAGMLSPTGWILKS